MQVLDLLNEDIIRCRRCPRLVAYREMIARTKRRQYQDCTYWGRPLAGFGDHRARLYVVGLAPAAHGGNRTGRIFTGDRSGDWLFEALHRYGFANQPTSQHRDDGLRLSDCYIGASVRCAPPDNKPSLQEFANCRSYLVEELRALGDVRVAIALGQIAFGQYLKVCRVNGLLPPGPALRFGHGASYDLPWGVTLLASYHPSQQNTFTGRLTKPMFHQVFARARSLLSARAD